MNSNSVSEDIEMQNNKNETIEKKKSIDHESLNLEECENNKNLLNLKMDQNDDSLVYHKFIIKSITDIDDRIFLIATGIQKCLIPTQHELELKNNLKFDYRINDEAVTTDYITERKTRVVDIINNHENPKYKIATVTTNSMKLPLQIEMILNHFPARIYKATVKIELTSRKVDKKNKSGYTLRPMFVYPKNSFQNLIRINNTDENAVGNNPNYNKLQDVMDKTKIYDILTPIPFAYGITHHKKTKNNEDVIYTPVIEIGFYLFEPILEAFFNMISPILIIKLLLTSTIIIDMDDTSYLGIMVGLILAVVFVIKNIRRQTDRSEFNTTDFYIIIFLLGLSICSIGVLHTFLRYLGVCISWLSSFIPIIGFFRYYSIKNRIISNSNKFNGIIQNPKIKEKSEEEIIFDDLIDLPTKEKPLGFFIE